MKITYKRHEETEFTKAHTDVLLNGEDIGYYVLDNDEYTCFIELNGEIYVEDFESEDDLKTNIKYFLEEC
jgi:hypothetical protein